MAIASADRTLQFEMELINSMLASSLLLSFKPKVGEQCSPTHLG